MEEERTIRARGNVDASVRKVMSGWMAFTNTASTLQNKYLSRLNNVKNNVDVHAAKVKGGMDLMR